MKKTTVVAIMGAVSAYIQQEEVIRAFAAVTSPQAQTTPWRLFGRQELMRSRTDHRTRRIRR